MSQRLNPFTTGSNLIQLLVEFGTKVAEAGLEKNLIELVKIRASQLNGCTICLHMHTQAARQAGESEERLYMLNAWRESPLYSVRERAALAWTEALTLLASSRAPDEDYRAMKEQFSDEESIQLTMMINVINCFNRIGVGYRVSHPNRAPRTAA